MIALAITLVLIIIVGIIGYYTNVIKQSQTDFIIVSSVLYIIIFGIIRSFILSKEGLYAVLMNNKMFYPLVFYILWYFTSSLVGNKFTGSNNYQGFFDNTNKYMSKRGSNR